MRTRTRHWGVSAAGGLCALLLHALFLAPLVFGGAKHRRPPLPDQLGGGANLAHSSSRMVESMTLIDLLNTEPTDETPLEELASLGIEIPRAAVVIASPELAPVIEFEEEPIEDAAVTEAAGNTQGHAAMFGRYLGQITARIERAWLRPRTALDAVARFSCQAKIEQNETGKVLSVELRHCNGSARWQGSLVSAIEHASPLPAPPVPAVFARMLVLNFTAQAWEEGVSNARLYEPEIRMAQVDAQGPSQMVTNEGKTLVDVASHRGNIELRIDGSTTRWTLHDDPENQSVSESRKE